MTNDTEFMTVNEVAKTLSVDPTTVTRWWKKFGLPLYRLARCVVRIRRTDFEDFMKNHETGIYHSTKAEFGYPAIAQPQFSKAELEERRERRLKLLVLDEYQKELELRRREREKLLEQDND